MRIHKNFKVNPFLVSMIMWAIILCCSSQVQAAQDGDYTYTVTDGQATITKYTGGGGVVTIPRTLGGAPVTSIGENAFYQCTGLTSISLPQGLTSIGYGAFSMCTGLKAISIPQEVVIIGERAFSMCAGLTYICIPQGVTSVGAGAFWSCTGLTGIRFNSATTTISSTIPASTTIIGYDPSTAKTYAVKYNNPFKLIGAITGVSLNKNVTTIKVGANETLRATITPDTGTTENIKWSVTSQSGNNVAAVSATGLVTGINLGTAVIKATSSDDATKYAECSVTVTTAVDKSALRTALENASILLGNYTIGTTVGDVPQAAYDAYNNSVTIATSLENNDNASQDEVDQAIALLKQATIDFLKFTNANTSVQFGKGKTQAEIISKYNQYNPAIVNSIFTEEPSIISPYSTGKVNPDFLQNGLNWLNFVRYIDGLPDDVSFYDYYMDVSQHGAVLLAANDELNHHPSKPQDMEEGFYQFGYQGTSHGNLGLVPGLSTLEYSINAWLYDADDQNTLVKELGHRRWMLNPGMSKTGFGIAETSEKVQYSVIFAHDDNGRSDYDSIAWPAKGAFPAYFLNMWGGSDPWSISLNPNKYDNSRVSNIKVKVTNRETGISWESDQSKNYDEIYPKEYFKVATAHYGIPYCIIFYPGNNFQYQANDTYDVEITGLFKLNSNEPTTIKYSTSLFDLFSVTDVSMNKASTTITQGQTEQLTASVLPSNTTNKDVTWSESGSNIATVSDTGLVTAVNPGTTLIRATSNTDATKYAECSVTVLAVDNTVLVTAITNAENLLASKTIGTAAGNVSQEVHDAYNTAITSSNAVKDNATATQTEIDAAVTALATATTTFNNAIVSSTAFPAQQNISLYKEWRIGFSQPVDSSTIQSNILLLRLDPVTHTKVKVDITPIIDPYNSNMVIVKHSAPFVAGATYELSVDVGIKDVSGRSLSKASGLSFMTLAQ